LLLIGTRGSALALAQARSVAAALAANGTAVELIPIKTTGDTGGAARDKSRFVKEIEEALFDGRVDLAVHSAKDVPSELPDGLELVAAPAAEDASDALVGAASLADVPAGARVGTSSLRRRSQLLALRPDVELAELRGNVDTRLGRLVDGRYEAIVLALAGLRRLGRDTEAGHVFDPDEVVPAAGQGILVLEARKDDATAIDAARCISDATTMSRLAAERALVRGLDASCRTPVAAHARLRDASIEVQAYVGLPNGGEWVRDRIERAASDPAAAGEELAERMLAAGAGDILRRAEEGIAA
jgi:hydroxymethylbilane synthase